MGADQLSRYHARARERGVNPIVYWIVRGILQPLFQVYFRMSRIGREHIPVHGPVILAANHRSFLDPFVIGMSSRRPIYYVAKQELFHHRLLAWFVASLGAFPVRRGQGDADTIETAKAILARGDAVLMFPEGTRIRPGALGRPRRGVGRLALETGAPVVPVAVFGTEQVRRGWRIRPRRIRLRIGRPMVFPRVEHASAPLAAAVTDRIWPNVMLQWEWLGGLPAVRHAAVIGAGGWGTAVAVLLARAGVDVELGCPSRARAVQLDEARENAADLPGTTLPERVRPVAVADLRLSGHDLVVFAVPAGELPAALAIHGPAVPPRAGVLVVSRGVVPPLGTDPVAYVAERTSARAVGALGGPAEAADALRAGARLVLAAHDGDFARQVADMLSSPRLDVAHVEPERWSAAVSAREPRTVGAA